MQNSNRPTSPHLGIYKWQITMVLSITHRMTGLALVAGSFIIVLWLWSAAYAPIFYTQLHDCLATLPGLIVLGGFTFAFFFHLCNGIRHLFWDIGKGFEIHLAAKTGWLVVVAALAMTALTWWTILSGGWQ